MIRPMMYMQQAPIFLTQRCANHLLFVLRIAILITLVGSAGLLSPDAAGTPATERRGQREVDVLLGVETDDEGRDVDDLLANAVCSCQ